VLADLPRRQADDVEHQQGLHPGRMLASAPMLPRPRVRRVRIPGVARLPEGEARKVQLQPEEPGAPQREVVLARLGGRLYALDSLCPHEGGRLAEGPLWDGRFVACPLHLYRFDPRTGAADGVECKPARTYAVREVDGIAELELAGDDGKG
jgi:nitrite reductase/ring-hydroxylating ferredoxin subunit